MRKSFNGLLSNSGRQNHKREPIVKILRAWYNYASHKVTRRMIVKRFKQFRDKLRLTKCFLSWADEVNNKSNFFIYFN